MGCSRLDTGVLEWQGYGQGVLSTRVTADDTEQGG